jgi:hypothetical protein
MPRPSALLQKLLGDLTSAKQGSTLVLDKISLGSTSAAALLRLFSDQLRISSFTLGNVVLPGAVVDNTLAVSGHSGDVTLSLLFQDAFGEIAIQALFQALALAPLQKAFAQLPADFFAKITIVGATASVTVPGLAATLTLNASVGEPTPRLGIVGLVTPSSGLVTTSIAPRVDGQVSPPSGAKGLLVELETATSGYRIAPLSDGWAFSDFGWLMPGLDIHGAFPSIIPTNGLGLCNFDLKLYTQAPDLSSLSLDVADVANPKKRLWSAANGKVALTDVVVTIGLTYKSNALALAGGGSVQGNFLLDSLVLEAQIPFPLSGVWSLTAYPDAPLDPLGALASLIDGGAEQLKSLPDLFDPTSFKFTYLRLAIHAGDFSLVEFSFALGSTKKWPLVPGVVEIDSLAIGMTIDNKPSLTGSVSGTIGLPNGGGIVVVLGRNDATLPWRLDAISPAVALPSLGDLAKLAQGESLGDMVKAGGLDKLRFVMTDFNFGVEIAPSKLTKSKLTNFGLTLQLANANDPLKPDLHWELIPGVLTLTEFSFGFQLTWGNSASKEAFGTCVINGLEFDIRFAKPGASSDALVAEYAAQGAGGTVDVKQLINAISPSVAKDLPDGLDIDLADALLAYINTGTAKYLFAMDISVEMTLSNLPLIGKAVPADLKVGLKNLKLVVASAAMSADDVALINTVSPRPVLPLPAANATGDAIPKGLSVLAELELGNLSILVASPSPKPTRTAVGPAAAMTALAVTSAEEVTWIDIEKTFGPVTIQKVGFSYSNRNLSVLANLSLAAGGLEIDLLGLGIGSPIAHPQPHFTIHGLAVSFQEGPISVMGGTVGTLEPQPDFVGALAVRAPELSLAAFAGYSEYEDHPSFFLYGVLDLPIGGPPAFFVTGLAAGLGFNRKLVVPDVSGVASFPLVAWALGSGAPSMDPTKPLGGQVDDALAQLAQSGVVAPSLGDSWFAAGVRFTSFELVGSFALFILTLGADFEVDVLGLSKVCLPPPPDNPDPVVSIELELEASFKPAQGVLSISGQLTQNSYVLSKDCHLTGGFAFYVWFAGDHEGEFLVTAGGYSPRFTPPSYYPSVPRLGLRWQVSGTPLTITGQEYFAVTSSAVMAGGSLNAVWNGGAVSAWFSVEVDFLMVYQPFHYYLSGNCQLGASFTIDLWFVSITITIHLGVGIEIWGPDFTGLVHVDLSIISFTIPFGASDQQHATTIEWSEFVNKLLPKQPERIASATGTARRGRRRPTATALGALAADAPAPKPAIVQITVAKGLLKTLSNDDAAGHDTLINHVVDSEMAELTVASVIPIKPSDPSNPAKDFSANIVLAPANLQPKDKDRHPITPNLAFGVGPTGTSPAKFQSTLTVKITSNGDARFDAVWIFNNVPASLWQERQFDTNTGVPQNVDPLNGTTIPNAPVGWRLVPTTATPDHTLPIPLEYLQYTLDTNIQHFAFTAPIRPTSGSFGQATVPSTINSGIAVQNRPILLDAIKDAQIIVPVALDVDDLASAATYDLASPPVLSLLGAAT